MPWTPIAQRFNQLPLILAGPLLRHTTYDEVTVWVAIKEASTVTLTIYQEEGNAQLAPLFSGARPTVQLGRHLHVVAVTAHAPPNQPLAPGHLYYYDLQFAGGAIQGGLRASGVVSTPPPGPGERNALSYSDTHLLPSFALPPDDLNKLRIVHGSCRKTHSEGRDATEALDRVLAADWAFPDRRPHQVFFTGDQIYADEVPACLLAPLTDAGNFLLAGLNGAGQLDWEETLAGDILPLEQASDTLPVTGNKPSQIPPGSRRRVVLKKAAFSTREGQNHLLGLGEYLAMYLAVWADVIWPPELPTHDDLFSTLPADEGRVKHFNAEREAVLQLRTVMPPIRRALANIPSYMICDDHETTDDWYVTREWCADVMQTQLGRRVMLNAMLAYAVCQAWGNTPEQYTGAEPGAALLSAASAWVQSNLENGSHRQAVAQRVGIPDTEAEVSAFVASVNQLPLGRVPRTAQMLDWHYTRRWRSHEVIALDVRTWRGFAGDPLDPPIQITDEGMLEQLAPSAPPVPLTLVLAPTNVLLVPLMHLGERWYIQTVWAMVSFLTSVFKREEGRGRGFARTYDPDLADSWVSQTDGYEKFIAWLATRNVAVGGAPRSHILVLSGDVHFGWAGRMQYAAQRPYQVASAPAEAVVGHLTVSGLDNQVGLWNALHHWGFIPGDNFPQPRIWLGWSDPATPGLSTIEIDRVASWDEDISFRPWMLERTPPMLRLKEIAPQLTIPEPDWLYRSDCVRGEKVLGLEGVTSLTSGQYTIDNLADALRNHRIYADQGAAGLEIIGKNNFGDVTFQWDAQTHLVADALPGAVELRVAEVAGFPPTPFYVWLDAELIEVREVDAIASAFRNLRRGVGDTPVTGHAAGSTARLRRQAVQHTWWRTRESAPLQVLTRFSVSLEFDDPEYPMPTLLPAPTP